MQMTIESTDKVISCNGVECRVSEGESKNGVSVIAFITRVAALSDADQSEFIKELQQVKTPSVEVQAIPARLIL